ncbi:LysR family transcriptional regulator [Pseudomonas putida]|uniref:LysR family transcriptional regulator n=1 Tax=Pseudomonas putida TaxID=303 RepID=UPI0018AA06D7|nr:LysR family transcriptional regulator [Pseudomonas putida]MBF8670395.1 LysR family transcriptional regulator [Pseudomonas putida]MBF8713196.1 LysR family transcriptional regulator [Pseudomonas putida]
MGKGLDINVLRTFQAVARLGRFKDAADYVHRSPSAVTTQIQKLEEQIGQQLFARSNQSVELTPAGRHLLVEATRFLMAHDRLLATLSPQQMTGKVRLGVPDGYAASLMSDFLPVFVASNPKLELEAIARSSAELVDLFARQRLDLAVAVSSEAWEQGEWLRSTRPRWAAAPGFHHDPDRPLPLALQLKGCPYRKAALQALKTHGIAYRILLESANWHAVLACMRSGLAVGIVEGLDSGDTSLEYVEGMGFPELPEHHVYLLTDTSHHVASHLNDMLKAAIQKDGPATPGPC